MIMDNDIVLWISKLQDQVLIIPTSKKKKKRQLCEVIEVLASATVAITLKYINVSIKML